MMNEATWQYIRAHADHDVRSLALRGTRQEDVDLPMALQQIQGCQTARQKLPSWAAQEGIVYPPHLAMEQCSSEATARHKAALAAQIVAGSQAPGCTGSSASRVAGGSPAGSRLVDLTGGLGVDFHFMSQAFEEAVYVEQQPHLHALAQHNLPLLQAAAEADGHPAPRLQLLCMDGTSYLRRMPHATLVFIDPARRDSHGGRTFALADCTPNVLPLLPTLLAKADRVLLKLSPMLDWRKAMADVGPAHVEQVHIVATDGDCRELLLLLSAQDSPQPLLVCRHNEESFQCPIGGISPSVAPAPPSTHLYEPNPALMKAGVFAELAARYGVAPLAANSHLFTADHLIDDFPGRKFVVQTVSTMNKRDLREKVLPLGQANMAVRNFPLSVAELRRRLKIGEGGGHYLFATTLATGEHVLLVCVKP